MAKASRDGLLAVALGVVAIVVTPALAALVIGTGSAKAEDIQAISSPAVSAIASIVAAYFGISLGQQGKSDAEAKKDQAKDEAAQAKAEAAATRAVALATADRAVAPEAMATAIRQALVDPRTDANL